MKYNEIKINLKKDPPGSLWILFHRKLGIVLTWLIINIYPKVNPNHVTLSMLVFNIFSSVLLYVGIVNSSIIHVVYAFLIFTLSLTIDCVDGNLARIQKRTSYLGVYYDRVVHNFSHPLIFLLSGLGISRLTNNVNVMLIFSIAAIVSEFSPIEMAVNDVKISFLNQVFNKTSKNFNIKNHLQSATRPTQHHSSSNNGERDLFHEFLFLGFKIIKVVISFETFYLIIGIEVFYNNDFIYTILFTITYTILHLIKGFFTNDLKKFLFNLSDFCDNKNNN